MTALQASLMVLLVLFCVASFLVTLSAHILEPFLVPLAHAFQTSIALVRQLAAGIAIPWGSSSPS